MQTRPTGSVVPRPAQFLGIAGALSLIGACTSSSDTGDADAAASVDGSSSERADASGGEPDGAAPADASVPADADLTARAAVEVDGEVVEFESILAYDGGASDRTISAKVGSDCPFGADCITLYVSFPRDAQPGYKNCDDVGSVQLEEGGTSYYSFGSSDASCGFRLELNDGETVAISSLSATLEANNSPSDRKILSQGEMVGPFN